MVVTVQKLFVAGAGFMGHGIAQVAASAGLQVSLYDLNEPILSAAIDKIRWSLDKLCEKGRLQEPPQTVLRRLTTSSDLTAAAETDMVIEAIQEQEKLKRQLFEKLDRICGSQAVFASNTSAIPISHLAAATGRADRFCGMHFFGPVQLMNLIEVIRGVQTSDQTVDAVMSLARRLGKEPVLVSRDVSGFVVNRILLAATTEAIRLVESGVAQAAEVDKAMRLGCGWKMGPLETADMSGLDIYLQALQTIYEDCGDGQFIPPMLLRRLVAAGQLGRKTGQGFYQYRTTQEHRR